jgi:uncharacterized membrane protein HdeD (DUF308 family)
MEGSTFLIIRGIVSVLFGVLAFAWPGITLAALVMVFGAYALVDGVVNLVLGLTSTPSSPGRSWTEVLLGIVGIAAGALTFWRPGITLVALVSFIAAWAILRGILDLVAAVRLRRVIAHEWLLALSGVLSVLFGLAVLAFPLAGALSIAWLLGAYALALGVTLIMLGIRLRRPSAA